MIDLAATILLTALQSATLPETGCMSPLEITGFADEQAFVQTREFAGMDQKIVSSGSVRIEGETIVWSVFDPILIVTRISGTSITQAIEHGPEEPVGSAGPANPLLAQSGLVDLLRGDLQAASTVYDVEIPDDMLNPWTVALTPQDDDLATVIASITISGCRQVEALRVNQSNGDVIAVSFSDD